MGGRTGAIGRLFLIASLFIALITPVAASDDDFLTGEKLAPLSDVVEDAVREGKIPGAVVLIGDDEKVIYRRAFGYRELLPERVTMTADTVFDLASLTKVVATTTAVMQLVEKKKIGLDVPAAKYWPAFRAKGKARITVRQLLTHYSGLRPDLRLNPDWSGYGTAMKMIVAEKPLYPPGSRYVYSDINFEILGELVRRVSGEPLDRYCARNIFRPLGMKDTSFLPPSSSRERIAPTEFKNGKMLRGEVHDPTCYNMGGVSGHAGLYSTADDLSVFARMLLQHGRLRGARILGARTVEKMTSSASPRGAAKLHGLGWEIGASFCSNGDRLPPSGSFGHLGYTGTSLWIDPVSGIYVIILTNRVHPDGRGDVRELRSSIKSLVSDAIGSGPCGRALGKQPSAAACERGKKSPAAGVKTGIDILREEDFSSLRGLRIGLITNCTGIDSSGRRTIDLLYKAHGVKLAAIFTPEHGLSAGAEGKVASTEESITGLPVYSLYGSVMRPTKGMLEGIDALVFDVQDEGARFFTYISTMGYAMEEAAKRGIGFYVLDRPNPINSSIVEGPVMEEEFISFTGYFPLALRHGMTVGELALMFNAEKGIGARLHIIRMRGYRRDSWFDETGLKWVNPSPNLHSVTESILYPGVAIIEGANVSVGRGTDSPFELLGAPWIRSAELSRYLNKRGIAGVSFAPVRFTPKSDIYAKVHCEGVRITLTDRQSLDASVLGIEIASALRRLYGQKFTIQKTLSLIGSRSVMDAIIEGKDPSDIPALWEDRLGKFLAIRSKYLLY